VVENRVDLGGKSSKGSPPILGTQSKRKVRLSRSAAARRGGADMGWDWDRLQDALGLDVRSGQVFEEREWANAMGSIDSTGSLTHCPVPFGRLGEPNVAA
jgi:hypothetical protein